MTAVRPARRFAALGTAVACVLTLTSCGGGDAPSPPPDGWVRVESGRLSVAVPEEWVDAPAGTDPWTVAWADDADLAGATVLLSGSPDFGEDGADRGVSTFVAGAQVGGVPSYSSTSRNRVVETDEVEVERNEYTYELSDGTVHEGVFWAAADPEDGRTVALELTGADLPDDLVEQIQASIRVLEG